MNWTFEKPVWNVIYILSDILLYWLLNLAAEFSPRIILVYTNIYGDLYIYIYMYRYKIQNTYRTYLYIHCLTLQSLITLIKIKKKIKIKLFVDFYYILTTAVQQSAKRKNVVFYCKHELMISPNTIFTIIKTNIEST